MEPAPWAWDVRPTLSAELSRRLIDAAVSEAAQLSVPVTVVTVDESGVVKALHRMDGAPLVSIRTAQNEGLRRGRHRDADRRLLRRDRV